MGSPIFVLLERTVKNTLLKHPEKFRTALLKWSSRFETAIFLCSNNHSDPYGNFDAALAVGKATSLVLTASERAFDKLERFRESVQDWIFGYLSYDLKNGIENLKSNNSDRLDFPQLFFFQPLKIFILKGDVLTQLYLPEVKHELESDVLAIQQFESPTTTFSTKTDLKILPKITQNEYIAGAKKMLDHIHRGDIYEANFCQEFFAAGKLDPIFAFQRLNEISQAPFAAYFKAGAHHILCTSPERYLRKNANLLISQPIKGTARRGRDVREDKAIAEQLAADPKERSENVMITDLVRNDLSRIAEKGSVKVEALCEVHSYKQVHQMLSTISARIKPDTTIPEILKSTFPMGSMTGAPKIAAMEIIEKLESSRRGVYSGALGYFTPDGDFDFNVVIRSILYNADSTYISFSVGSAITAKADPEREYEECLLKAEAMRKVVLGF